MLDVVAFPGPVRRQSAQFVPTIPEECQRMGICEDLPGYPEEHVATLIEGLGNETDKFHMDELITPPEAAQRDGSPKDNELCRFSSRVVVPKAAPDRTGIWHFILNRKDRPLQGFHVEICQENNSSCSSLAHFYTGYLASCRQKFMMRYMASLDSDGNILDRAFKIPSCCSCVVEQPDDQPD